MAYLPNLIFVKVTVVLVLIFINGIGSLVSFLILFDCLIFNIILILIRISSVILSFIGLGGTSLLSLVFSGEILVEEELGI